MGVRKQRVDFVYGVTDNLLRLPPQPIIATRNPTTNDFAQLGTAWVNKSSGAIYGLAAITANEATWVTSPASGAGTFSAVTVTTGNTEVSLGDVIVSAGDLELTSGSATIGGDLTVAGTLSFTGDLDLSSAALIDLTSTLNAAPSIYLHANGGTSEQIRLRSDQGTAVNSVLVDSDVGGITISAGLASDDAINLSAGSGGVDIDGALQVNIASSEDAADALVLSASAGGIDISAAGEAGQDIDITNTGGSVNISATEDAASAVTLTTNGGTSETMVLTNTQGTSAGAIALTSSAGGITLTSNLASDDGINLSAVGGGIDMDCALQLNLTSTENAADAISINATAGGIDIIATGAAGEDLDLTATNGSVNITSGEADADAIVINASDAGGGINIDAGTTGIAVDTTGAISLDAAAASNFTATGAFDVTLSSTAGSMIVDGGEAVSDAVQITASNAAGGVAIAAGTGGIDLSAAGICTMTPATASNAGTSVTINANVGVATFTGQTTASGAQETFTITNSVVAATSAIMCTVANVGANDARMTLEQVKPAAGSFEVMTQNNGAAALNGDVIITFWVIA